jgi:hypothetical protein
MLSNPLPLRDIHLPEAISGWPPAIGWWLLAVLMPVTLLLAYKLYNYLTRKTAVKAAKKLLAALQDNGKLDNGQKLAALSVLLRRVAISVSPHTGVAGLTGAAWLEFLDSPLNGTPFSTGVGARLIDAPYRKTPVADAELAQLMTLCENWLAQCVKRKSAPHKKVS